MVSPVIFTQGGEIPDTDSDVCVNELACLDSAFGPKPTKSELSDARYRDLFKDGMTVQDLTLVSDRDRSSAYAWLRKNATNKSGIENKKRVTRWFLK